MSSPPLPAERAARIIHWSLVAGVAVIVPVFGALRGAVAVTVPDDLRMPLRAVAAVLIVVVFWYSRTFRRALLPIPPGGDRDEWWRSNLKQVIPAWALAEGVATVGAVLWFLTGESVFLAGLTGLSLAVLVMLRPRVLMGL